MMPDIDSKLLVPIAVQALVLSKAQKAHRDLRPNLQKSNSRIIGDALQPKINSKLTLEKGVHLHWTLPKALKHAFVEEDKEMQFPYTPNRWMVIRLQTDTGLENIPSKAWIVESDVNNEIIAKRGKLDPVPNWVVFEDKKIAFKNVGKTTPWSEAYTESITTPTVQAVGAVNPLFASFYPDCKDVFGFHDDMEGVAIGSTCTYVVTGWYNDPAIDPIHPLEHTSHTQKTVDWIQQQWRTNAETYPTTSIFHTTVHSLKWDTNQSSGVPVGDIQIYAGNTAVESLSAQIFTSDATSNDPAVETLLNALQYQLLDDDRNQPSLSSIKTAVHHRSFIPRDRNIIWEVVSVVADTAALQEGDEARIHFPDDPDFLSDLNALNKAQLEVNVLLEDIERLRQEAYFLWYKQVLKISEGYSDITGFDFETSRKLTIDAIASKDVDVKLLTKEIDDLIKKLKNQDPLSGADPEFELTQKLEDRFWEPNEPVLLLCGDGVGDTDGLNFQAVDSVLTCRTQDQLIKELRLKIPEVSDLIPISIASFSVPAVDALSSETIPHTIIKGIVYESLLLDQSLAIDIALLAYKNAKFEQERTSGLIKELVENVVIKEQTHPTLKDPNWRAPEPFSILKWKQAWVPLFMTWEAVYTPSDDSLDTLDLLETDAKWILEEGISFKNQSTETASNSVRFQGISPFSNAVFANLKELIPKEIVDKYGELHLIAQSLSGLNKHLLMQRPGVQLPPFNYTLDTKNNIISKFDIDEDELKLIGSDGYVVACHPGDTEGTDANRFFPLRSGMLEIRNLSIIDAFGQEKKVIDSRNKNTTKDIITESVALGGGKATENTRIPLPPRILQPSRLQFHWLNLRDEVIYQDTGTLETPVFGWLVPNFMDNSIMVYDHLGQGVVQLQISKDFGKAGGVILSKLPFPGTDKLGDLSINTQLKQVLDGIDSGTIVSGIMDLAQEIHETLTQARGVQNNSMSLLFGQPIALARCSVGLELLGLPAYNQRWDQSGKQNSGGIESMKFPLFIGDYAIENDGVLGYFSDDDYTHFHTPLHTPESSFRESEPYFTKDRPLKLSLEEGAQKVTVLMHAAAGMQLSSGILPSKFVELFRHSTNEVLESLQTSFMVAPFIADKVDPGIPIPTSINTGWKWTHKSNVNTWEESQQLAQGKNKQRSSFKKQHLYEGWLTLDHLKNKK